MSVEEQFRERFLLQGIASGPATTEQIDQFENVLGHRLPAAYRAYLRVCGTHPPKHFVGSDCVLDHVVSNNESAIELFLENGIDQPDTPIVTFMMHQGYFFEYFLIDGTDDPAVYSYMEGDDHIKQSAGRFSEWVAAIPGHMST